MKNTEMCWAGHCLRFTGRPLIMGIVNVTPDSFSDGGAYFDATTAIEHGLRLAREGADILDIGGESSRPFSEPVSAEEEMRRVIPVIEGIAEKVPIPLSIDTTKGRVARRAIQAGAGMVNDISALRMDEKMAPVVRDSGVPLILMHMLGSPKTMQIAPRYGNLIEEIHNFLKAAIQEAIERGIQRDRILIDPGIGFGKTLAHNLLLIQQLHRFVSLGCPILLGPSRKAFIRRLLKPPGEKALSPDSPLVETGTQAAVAAAALAGVHILRVHRVAETLATLKVIDAIGKVQKADTAH
jgi:dihydropteroate synthase